MLKALASVILLLQEEVYQWCHRSEIDSAAPYSNFAIEENFDRAVQARKQPGNTQKNLKLRLIMVASRNFTVYVFE